LRQASASPRDGDWHAAYVLYTPGKQLIELRRLEYDIWTAQDKIVAAGLPNASPTASRSAIARACAPPNSVILSGA